MTYYATNTIHYWHTACIKCNMYDRPDVTFLTCVPIIILSSVYASQWRINFGRYSEKTCKAGLTYIAFDTPFKSVKLQRDEGVNLCQTIFKPTFKQSTLVKGVTGAHNDHTIISIFFLNHQAKKDELC